MNDFYIDQVVETFRKYAYESATPGPSTLYSGIWFGVLFSVILALVLYVLEKIHYKNETLNIFFRRHCKIHTYFVGLAILLVIVAACVNDFRYDRAKRQAFWTDDQIDIKFEAFVEKVKHQITVERMTHGNQKEKTLPGGSGGSGPSGGGNADRGRDDERPGGEAPGGISVETD